jgi:hypothetical protein
MAAVHMTPVQIVTLVTVILFALVIALYLASWHNTR